MPAPFSDAELTAWLRLTLERDLTTAQLQHLLSAFGLPQQILAASTAQLARHIPPELATRLRQPPDAAQEAAIEQTRQWVSQPAHTLLTLADSSFPKDLYGLDRVPALLYAKGNLDCLRRPRLAIVGARSATPAGRDNARAFARYLAQRGWCIVSGLASGIDAAAHQGALEAGPQGGGTLAILGTGIDRVYPAAHLELAREIARTGLMLSEFPLGSPARPFHFPQRNRLVAALSHGVLVVEAATRSGSLITARLAAEIGREVFAIPGSIHSPLSRGCHALIRQGAKLVESGEDILEELRQAPLPVSPAHSPAATPAATHAATPAASTPGARDPEMDALLTAAGHDPVTLDQLQARTGWTVPDLMRVLTLGELQGHLTRQDDGRYIRQS